jgi:hypothetical protein
MISTPLPFLVEVQVISGELWRLRWGDIQIVVLLLWGEAQNKVVGRNVVAYLNKWSIFILINAVGL